MTALSLEGKFDYPFRSILAESVLPITFWNFLIASRMYISTSTSLCETRHIYCASPEYVKNNAPLKKPEDIRSHRVIQFGSAKRPKWSFTSQGRAGKTITVPVNPSMNSYDGEFLVHAAEHGQGIVRVPDFLANSSLKSGRLVQVLRTYVNKPRGIYIVYPTARYLPQQIRVLMEYLLEHVKND